MSHLLHSQIVYHRDAGDRQFVHDQEGDPECGVCLLPPEDAAEVPGVDVFVVGVQEETGTT